MLGRQSLLLHGGVPATHTHRSSAYFACAGGECAIDVTWASSPPHVALCRSSYHTRPPPCLPRSLL